MTATKICERSAFIFHPDASTVHEPETAVTTADQYCHVATNCALPIALTPGVVTPLAGVPVTTDDPPLTAGVQFSLSLDPNTVTVHDVVDVTVTATLAAGAPVVPVWIETIWHTPPVHVFGFVKVAVAPLTSA